MLFASTSTKAETETETKVETRVETETKTRVETGVETETAVGAFTTTKTRSLTKMGKKNGETTTREKKGEMWMTREKRKE